MTITIPAAAAENEADVISQRAKAPLAGPRVSLEV